MPRKKGNGYVWVQSPPTFTPQEKSKIFEQLKGFIDSSAKLKENEHIISAHPEFEGEYFKWNYARITFKDKSCGNCTADWQRANEQWIEFHKGTFTECLKFIDSGGGFFS